MSLWIYKCNTNRGDDWLRVLKTPSVLSGKTFCFGGPWVTVRKKFAESAQVGQEFLCWQRWTSTSEYDSTLTSGRAGAVGIVIIERIRKPDDEWVLRPVEIFENPVPLLEYKQKKPAIAGPFTNPRSLSTFIKLTAKEERSIRSICSKYPSLKFSNSNTKILDKKSQRISQSAGFGTVVNNKKVEDTAINFVRKCLKDQKWSVKSVEHLRGLGYDLEAKRGREEKHIEVKGISGMGTGHIVTVGEKRKAKSDPAWEIWIVSEALSSNPKVEVRGGRDYLAEFEFSPSAYRANLSYSPRNPK